MDAENLPDYTPHVFTHTPDALPVHFELGQLYTFVAKNISKRCLAHAELDKDVHVVEDVVLTAVGTTIDNFGGKWVVLLTQEAKTGDAVEVRTRDSLSNRRIFASFEAP